VVIPAADNANDWTADTVYQLYAATKDSYGVAGPYTSTGVVANVGAIPNVSITSATSTTSANYLAAWTVDRAQGYYQVRLLDGATVVYTTGKVADTSARAYTLNMPTNGKTYTVEVTVWDQTAGGGVSSSAVTKSVTTSFTPVATPTIAVTPSSANGYNGIAWTNPAPGVGEPNPSYVDLYRDGKRIAQSLPINSSYADYSVASGVNYSYYVTVVGDNQTAASSVSQSGSITLDKSAIYLHEVFDPAGTYHAFTYRDQVKDEPQHASATFKFAGRSYPTKQYDAKLDERNITVRIAIPDDTTDRAALEKLYATRSTLCFRDGRGRKCFVTLDTLPEGDEKWGGWVDLSLGAVSFNEVR
jgi:hypothetical protein